ncbi:MULTISPECIES: GTP diphosphokinase [unclassified Gilliamella]|uniref:GTP diphosphokinase n=1 Tax=unclassified Gilliamella TaxID=2685620 RepID=UPI002269F64A|nr:MULTISPECIES: GTP diphosphokinase [unclassified Gilliamella]MCX8641395.1 GTP diphosphokinase [Gilliamella sp. B3835]MCX8707505.1 GTP diphosphokinase [Gilliamella sp. B3783]MCX8710585.1 GTP diphosphokinase [Gilliamella sp. B3780]MCX8711239.1 GTP diphosphokinase [Gilliamella sp. B3468]MCX8714700.1 GTP diphosphokinase [Gilliamella sp. B3781]
MVSIRGAHQQSEEHYSLAQFDVEQWAKQELLLTNPQSYEKFKDVWDFCFENSAGAPEQLYCFKSAIEMVEILSTLSMDVNSLSAALLLPFLESKIIRREDIPEDFDREITHIISSIIRMKDLRQLRAIRNGNATTEQIDSIRRMLLAMVNDFRSVVIKIAERITYLRNLMNAPKEEQVLAAKECFNIYAPLANRLGIGQLKWELEDFCFRYLYPDQYRMIAIKLQEKRLDRELYINKFVKTLQDLMNQDHIHAEVYGRPKHIYSIWRKMERKHLQFEELYDIRAVRIICDRVEDCYNALGIVHSHYKHIAKEFDDYVANPKPNGYQSIHTVVYGPQDKTIEIQIRTEQMHNDAELGIAAHWKYKEGTTDKMTAYDQRISWLRQLLTWQKEMSESGEIQEAVRSQIFDDRVYVFTPKGDVVDLPAGSTPLDFAYHIHSDVGHRCIGAKVNGRIVPFTYMLKIGDQVEVITQKQPNPSRDWLNPNTGFVNSSRARAKIQAWFKKQDRDKNIAAGQQILENELEPLNISIKSVEKILIAKYNAHSFDEVLAGIGSGDIRINQLVNFINAQFNKPTAEEEDEAVLKQISQKSTAQTKNTTKSGEIIIEGVGNLMYTIANCCRPIPGDPIVGFVTQGRGISIHRADCEQLQELKNHAPERITSAAWSENTQSSYTMIVRIIANDRSGLLRDITTIVANEKVNVLGVSSRSDTKQQLATIDMDLQIFDHDSLNRVLNKIKQLPDVVEAKRFQG